MVDLFELRFSKACPDGIEFPIDESIDFSQTQADGPRVFDASKHIVAPDDPELQGLIERNIWPQMMDLVYRRSARVENTSIDLPHCQPGKIMRAIGIKNCEQMAQSVRADFPTHFTVKALEYFRAQGVQFRDLGLPQLSQLDFCNSIVLLSHLAGWAVNVVSPNVFALKWYFGRVRPEELVREWAYGRVLPDDVADNRRLNLLLGKWKDEFKRDSRKFTAYLEGCPKHPEFPAMHGAAAAFDVLLQVLLELSSVQANDVVELANDVAFARDNAGVHFSSGSIAGRYVGTTIVKALLPGELVRLGADAGKVAEAMKLVI